MSIKRRIAIVISHPIQHFCPQYASFAKDESIDLKVFFASTLGFKKYHDPNFGKVISWDNLGLDSFNHEFLNNGELIQADKNIDAPELETKLSEFNPDALIIYGYFQKLNRRAYRWARKNKVRLLYISDSEMKRQSNRLADMAKFPFLFRFFSGIDHFLTVGNSNEAYYSFYQVPAKKFIRMHFPIDITTYEKSYAQKRNLNKGIRSLFGIEDNELVLSVVGKLVSWKNQDHIIDALQMLEKEGVYAHLFILGSGEMMDSWKKKSELLQKSQVHFMGFVTPEELPAYYAASDIYIHPASLEPHSLAISEAIYMGCPVLISDRCGSYGETDDVQVNNNGFVYPCGNIRQLADMIKLLHGDPSLRKKFSEYSHGIATAFQHQSHKGVLKLLNSIIINAGN